MASVRTVGIVGAGTMGMGIAQVCATHGFPTQLYDLSTAQVDRALKQIEGSLDSAIAKGRLSQERKQGIISSIHPVDELSNLKADLIIEAAVERLDVKKQLFAVLEEANLGRAILATNTSSLSVSQIAASLRDPSRCIGLHFFNPAERMKLVEIISGKATDPAVREQLCEFAHIIQKTTVLAKDSPGFIVNRVARHYYVESLLQLSNGAASAEIIDRLMRSSGFRMGPFELMDLIGVDTNLAVTKSVYEGMNRPAKFTPNTIQEQMVREGKLGKKSGKGFYEYTDDGK